MNPMDIFLFIKGSTPEFFARVEEILPDERPGWWHLEFTRIGVPMIPGRMLVSESHMNGESFTIEGIECMFIVVPPRVKSKIRTEVVERKKPEHLSDKVVSIVDAQRKQSSGTKGSSKVIDITGRISKKNEVTAEGSDEIA